MNQLRHSAFSRFLPLANARGGVRNVSTTPESRHGVDLFCVEHGGVRSFVLRTDRFGAGLHLRRLIGPAGLAEQGSVVLQALRHIRMLGPEGLLPDRQGSPVERLGLAHRSTAHWSTTQGTEGSAVTEIPLQWQNVSLRAKRGDGE